MRSKSRDYIVSFSRFVVTGVYFSAVVCLFGYMQMDTSRRSKAINSKGFLLGNTSTYNAHFERIYCSLIALTPSKNKPPARSPQTLTPHASYDSPHSPPTRPKPTPYTPFPQPSLQCQPQAAGQYLGHDRQAERTSLQEMPPARSGCR